MLAYALALACNVPPAAALQDPSTPPPQLPQQTPPTSDELDRAVEELAGMKRDSGSDVGFSVGGYIAIAGLYSKTADLQSPADLSGFSLNAARLWFEGSVEDWFVHIGFRGEQYADPIPATGPGARLFGVAGEAGPLRPEEMYFGTTLKEDHLDVRVGRMKTPVLSSGLYEGNRLLFDHRTYNGEVVAFPSALDTGLELIGKLGPLRGWVAAQNGVDEAGDSTAFTVRGLWDVFGRPACLQNEGALNAPEDPALTIGGAIYFDTLDDNFSTQYLEAAFTLSRMSLQSEFVDNGSGFGGDLYSFGVTGSFLVLPDVEVAARYESASRDDGPYLWRFAANKYFDGHDVKAQLVYTTADSNTRRVNVDLFSLGLVASF